MRVLDRAFPALDRDIHVSLPGGEPRGARQRRDGVVVHQHESTPRGNSAALAASRAEMSAGRSVALQHGRAAMPGPVSVRRGPPCAGCRPARRGSSSGPDIPGVPSPKASSGGKLFASPIERKAACARVRDRPARRCGSAAIGDVRRRRQRRIEPDRRVVIAQCQRDRGRRRHSGGGGPAAARDALDACRAAPSRRARRGRSTAPTRPVGKAGRQFGDRRHRSALAAHQGEEIDLGGRGSAACDRVRAHRARASAPAHVPRPRRDRRRAAPARRTARPAAPCRGRGRAHSRTRSRRLASCTAARDTVASPRLNGAPSPPIRPRTMTSPLSGSRRSAWAGTARCVSRQRAISAPGACASTAIAALRRALRCHRRSVAPIAACHYQVVYVTRQLSSAAT